MDPYTFSLTLGGVGLGVMALSGSHKRYMLVTVTVPTRIRATATRTRVTATPTITPQRGDSYFRYEQIELLPQLAPAIADALPQAKLVTISSGGEKGAAETTTNSIAGVIQTVVAAQLVSRSGVLDGATPVLSGSDR
jgi:hypothetical protein